MTGTNSALQPSWSARLWSRNAAVLLRRNTIVSMAALRGEMSRGAPGYAFFLVNAGLGLAVTVILFGAMVRHTEIHYMLARILVSVVAGLMMFLFNATLNFGRL